MKDTNFYDLLIKDKDFNVKISYFHRPGEKGTIIFIHGLGCSKEDFIGATKIRELKNYGILAFDWPGAGNSTYPEKEVLGVDNLIEIIDYVNKKISLKKFILVGHSLGGVAGLLYAMKYPKKIAGFVNIEGSLISRNAQWSREVKKMGFEVFRKKPFKDIKADLKKSNFLGFRKYAKTLDSVSTKSYFDFSISHAKICKNNFLLNKFLKLKSPKVFIYGAENKVWLPVVKKLKENRCSVKVIPKSHHFSFIDNPAMFYKTLAKFTDNVFASENLDR